jgi:hypothetical protein
MALTAALSRGERLAAAAWAQGLLAAGGDERIALDSRTGLNRYGCSAAPCDRTAAFGSSTASVISSSALSEIARSRTRFMAGPGLAAAYAAEMNILRGRLASLCGLPAAAGENIVFAASGTDLHLIAAILASDGGVPLTAVLADPAETGRGVPDAVAGRRFAARAPHGEPGLAGQSLAGVAEGETIAVPVREPGGAPRAVEAVDADFERACERAVARGRRVLLNLVDVSKTGLVAPSRECASRLKACFGEGLTVLIDACQFRISNATLADYLDRGFLVAVTGSKFVTGPAFSGALFTPPAEAPHLRGRALPPALGDYSGRSDWPAAWRGRAALPDQVNLGMMLRWQAALHELSAFRALPEREVAAFAATFETAICATLEELSSLEPVAATRLDRTSPEAWDARRTIFSFLPLDADGPLSPDGTAALHRRLLSASSPIQLGQPVGIGLRAGKPLTALRLSLSARLIVEALTTRDGGEQVITRASAALRETAAQARLS